ncbi:unnamed protein product [Bathycoccus prasinos]
MTSHSQTTTTTLLRARTHHHHPKSVRVEQRVVVARRTAGVKVNTKARSRRRQTRMTTTTARESNTIFATSAKCALSVATALIVSGIIPSPPLAVAELNSREANQGGEFNRGSAQQFGGYDLRAENVSEKYGTDLRLSNFTGAEMRDSKLVGAKLNGAYLMKAVAANADFTDADLSDALMDRGVFVNANFTNAILARVVLTSSDLNGANITNADFSDALLDNTMQMKLCKIATGTNPTTGVNTRKSLNCTGGRGNVGSPSRYMTEEDAQKPEAQFEASRFSAYQTK